MILDCSDTLSSGPGSGGLGCLTSCCCFCLFPEGRVGSARGPVVHSDALGSVLVLVCFLKRVGFRLLTRGLFHLRSFHMFCLWFHCGRCLCLRVKLVWMFLCIWRSMSLCILTYHWTDQWLLTIVICWDFASCCLCLKHVKRMFASFRDSTPCLLDFSSYIHIGDVLLCSESFVGVERLQAATK